MSTPIFIREEYVDVSDEEKSYIVRESDVYETGYTVDEIGKLYRACQKEHGRCVSKVYVDDISGRTKAIGWVFRSRKECDHCYKSTDTYLQETWITLYSGMPKTVTIYAKPIVIG